MNGTNISPVTGTMTGISQLKKISPYEKNQAETMSNQSKDIAVTGLGDTVVSGQKGSWLKVSGVDFSKGISSCTVRASSSSGAAIKICTGGTSGDVLGYVEVPAGGMTEITVPVNSTTGTKDVYFVFSGSINLDTWQFA